MTYRATDGVDR